jgi:outer membrane murein-binding lipoprotein Lpp
VGEEKSVAGDDLLLLMGKLSAGMDEGIRQRALQFEKLNSLSNQVTELSTAFNSHAENEEQWRIDHHAQMKSLAGDVGTLRAEVTVLQRAAEIEAPESIFSKIERKHVILGGIASVTGILFPDYIRKAIEWVALHLK